MGIRYGNYVAVDLAIQGIHGRHSIVAGPRLGFSVGYRSGGHGSSYVVRNWRAEIEVSRTNDSWAYLGLAWPESAWVLQVLATPGEAAILFYIDLSDEQLSAVERLRDGSGLHFRFRFLCEIAMVDEQGHERHVQQGSDEVEYQVNQSAWIDCLNRLREDRILLLEVELQSGQPELEPAIKQLERARQDLLAGNYDGSMQKCRMAVESIKNHFGLNLSKTYVAYRERRTEMSPRERAEMIYGSVHHFAHMAAHVDEQGASYECGRRDAMFLLALASAVVAHASGLSPSELENGVKSDT